MISVWVKLGETGGSMEAETKFGKNAMFLSKGPNLTVLASVSLICAVKFVVSHWKCRQLS